MKTYSVELVYFFPRNITVVQIKIDKIIAFMPCMQLQLLLQCNNIWRTRCLCWWSWFSTDRPSWCGDRRPWLRTSSGRLRSWNHQRPRGYSPCERSTLRPDFCIWYSVDLSEWKTTSPPRTWGRWAHSSPLQSNPDCHRECIQRLGVWAGNTCRCWLGPRRCSWLIPHQLQVPIEKNNASTNSLKIL